MNHVLVVPEVLTGAGLRVVPHHRPNSFAGSLLPEGTGKDHHRVLIWKQAPHGWFDELLGDHSAVLVSP